jgi:hypothetical protein
MSPTMVRSTPATRPGFPGPSSYARFRFRWAPAHGRTERDCWRPNCAGQARLDFPKRRWTKRLAGRVTAAEVTAALKEILPGDALQLTMLVPPDNMVKPERLLAVYTASSGRALKRGPAPGEELSFQYEDLGPPGQVARRERVEDLDLTLV